MPDKKSVAKQTAKSQYNPPPLSHMSLLQEQDLERRSKAALSVVYTPLQHSSMLLKSYAM